MDLDVVGMLERDAVLLCDAHAVSREQRIVRAVHEEAADATRGKKRMVRMQAKHRAVAPYSHKACAVRRAILVLALDKVDHLSVLEDLDVFELLHLCQKLCRDLLARDVLVEEDPRA